MTKRERLQQFQMESWDWFEREVDKYKPFDCVVCNGDAIDGQGVKSGGTELITPDREEQCDMAIAAIKSTMSRKTKPVIIYGTGYHTGNAEDWETSIAKGVGAVKVGSHEWVNLDGVIFDFKHHIGSSSVPWGRSTASAKEANWSAIWAAEKHIPNADVLIRSHVHYFNYNGDDSVRPYLRMTTPALQAMGTKYGSRRCSGTVSYGFLVFEACEGELTKWFPVTAKFKSQQAKTVVI